MTATYQVTVDGKEVNVFEDSDSAYDYAVAIKNNELPEYDSDSSVQFETENGMEEVEKRYTILLGTPDCEYIWDGSDFETKDGAAYYRRDYSYSAPELDSEFSRAKSYADEKCESGEWVVNSSNVYTRVEFF